MGVGNASIYNKLVCQTEVTTTTTQGPAVIRPFVQRDLVADEGDMILGDHLYSTDLETCKTRCLETEACNSFTFSAQQRKCYFKTKVVTADEPSKNDAVAQ